METFIAILTALVIIIAMPISFISLLLGSSDDEYTILERDAHFYD